jgi:cell division protein FtsW
MSWLARFKSTSSVPRTECSGIDPILAAVAIALIGFGIVMVFSASAVEATVSFGDAQYYLKRQVGYGIAAVTLMFVTARIDYHRLRAFTYPILLLVTVLLLACVVGFGHSGGGATRWLRLGPVHVQPSEMAKLALVLWLAYSLAKKQERVKSFSVGMLPHLLMAGGLMLLCLKQPDFGGAVVLLFLTFTLLFVAGARLGYLLGVAIVGVMIAAWLVRFTAYRWERVLAWVRMAEHRHDLAYQPYQAVMSFGSGRFTGLGLGKGLQVLYLPEAHTDFVAAIIGEELGFIGLVLVCAAYLLLVTRGVRAALLASDDFGAYVAYGISVMFGVQALVNLAVAMSILPTKGLTLPFISYGGSSLLVNGVAMGVLLNVSRVRVPVREQGGKHSAPHAEASAFLIPKADFSKSRAFAEPKGAT